MTLKFLYSAWIYQTCFWNIKYYQQGFTFIYRTVDWEDGQGEMQSFRCPTDLFATWFGGVNGANKTIYPR